MLMSTAGFLDMHDDVMFHIISFVHSPDIGGAYGYYEPMSVLFRQISYVSKSMRRLCLSYVRQTPLNFYWGADGLRSFFVTYWMAKKQVKVGSFIYPRQNYKSRVGGDMAEMIHAAKVLFRLCNVSHLKEVKLGRLNYANMSIGNTGIDIDFRHGMNAGLPESIADPLQSLFNTIAMKAISLESLQCSLPSRFCNVLSRFSKSLQTLDLYLTSHGGNRGQQSSDEKMASKCAQQLYEALRNMPKLKNLILNVNFPMELCIASKSLICIDVYQSNQDMWVRKCICPSLERFICRYDKNGARSVHPLSQEIVHEYEGKKDLKVAGTPFQGMQVSKECTVFFKLLWNDLVSGASDDLL